MAKAADVWGPSFVRLRTADRIEAVTASLRRRGHEILTVTTGVRLDDVKAAAIVTDLGFYCFPVGVFGARNEVIAAEFEKCSIAPLPPLLPGEESIELHRLAETLRLPSKYYLSRFDYERDAYWPISLPILWLLICSHEEAIYPDDVRALLPGSLHKISSREVHDVRSLSDVLVAALTRFADAREH